MKVIIGGSSTCGVFSWSTRVAKIITTENTVAEENQTDKSNKLSNLRRKVNSSKTTKLPEVDKGFSNQALALFYGKVLPSRSHLKPLARTLPTKMGRYE